MIAVAVGDVAAVLIANMPKDQRRVITIAQGELPDEGLCSLAIGLAAGTILLPRPWRQAHAMSRDGKALRMELCKPGVATR